MAKEFVVGAAGGVTQVLIGQPFDIIKVRMQTQANRNALQVGKDIWKYEGVLAFYKGTLPPLIGVGACLSIVYATFSAASQAIKAHKSHPSLSSSETYLAGGIAGLANSVISGPTEHIRIRLQTQSSSQKGQPGNGVLACVRHIHAQGGLTGLYRGQVPTMLREFGSYGVWFSVYGYLISRISSSSTSSSLKEKEKTPAWKIASCGAVTGVILWGVNYPFDVVKSKMQADGFGSDQKYNGMMDAVRQTWRADGVKGFFRGVGIATGRAAPVAAGTFVVCGFLQESL